jgi:hypothetical protein
MSDYRRGVASSRKNDLWHWNRNCVSYPVRAFAIRSDRPADDFLCSRCAAL